jgi:hypothetical protein
MLGLARIARLYQIEREAREEIAEAIECLPRGDPLDAAERLIREQRLVEEITDGFRQQQSRPVAEKFGEWLETTAGSVLPKSLIGEAIAYARTHWIALTRFVDFGFLSIDSNAAERAMRPIAVGRKNWLHLGSDRGGRTAAILMSLVQSCQSLKIEPLFYLRDVLNRVSTHPAGKRGRACETGRD